MKLGKSLCCLPTRHYCNLVSVYIFISNMSSTKMVAGMGFIRYKTGTCQCTQTVWSTFVDVHSTHWNFRASHITTHTNEGLLNLTTFIGFPFALVFACTLTECITYIMKYMSLTGIIMNFGRLRDIL